MNIHSYHSIKQWFVHTLNFQILLGVHSNYIGDSKETENKKSAHLTIADSCTPTNYSMVTTISLHSLFDSNKLCIVVTIDYIVGVQRFFNRATADRHMYDGGSVNSFDSHFANISDRHEISTLIILVDEIIHRQRKCWLIMH